MGRNMSQIVRKLPGEQHLQKDSDGVHGEVLVRSSVLSRVVYDPLAEVIQTSSDENILASRDPALQPLVESQQVAARGKRGQINSEPERLHLENLVQDL